LVVTVTGEGKLNAFDRAAGHDPNREVGRGEVVQLEDIAVCERLDVAVGRRIHQNEVAERLTSRNEWNEEEGDEQEDGS
jgi:hypothetical protein